MESRLYFFTNFTIRKTSLVLVQFFIEIIRKFLRNPKLFNSFRTPDSYIPINAKREPYSLSLLNKLISKVWHNEFFNRVVGKL